MNDINIQNIVASTRISDELDVEKLADCIHGSKYNPDQFPGLILHFDKPKTAALIFSSGKVICTGAKKMEEVDYTISTITKKISNIGIEVFDKPEIKI